MFLVKTSAPVLDTVRKQNKQLFRGEPKDWEAGEAVLFIRNKGDLEEGEKPIAVAAKIVKIRPVKGSEATDLASGVGGTFKFVAEYEAVTELVAPFDLEEAIGAQAADAYKRVTIARKAEAEDAKKLDAFVAARAPAKAEAPASEPVKAPEPKAEAKPATPKAAPAKAETPKAAAPKAASPKSEAPKPAAAKAESTKATAAKTEAPKTAAPKAEPEKPKAPAAAAAKAEAPEADTAKAESTKTAPTKPQAPTPAAPKAEAKQTEASKPAPEASDQEVPRAYLPWYLEPIELSRLSLGFFVAGAFVLGWVVS